MLYIYIYIYINIKVHFDLLHRLIFNCNAVTRNADELKIKSEKLKVKAAIKQVQSQTCLLRLCRLSTNRSARTMPSVSSLDEIKNENVDNLPKKALEACLEGSRYRGNEYKSLFILYFAHLFVTLRTETKITE